MLFMQMTAAVLLFSDALAWGFRGNGTSLGYAMVRVSNFLVFFMSDVLIAVFHGYTCCYLFYSDDHEWNVLKTSVRRNRKTAKLPVHRIRLVNLVAVIGMLLVILSQFYHFYYYFDRHNFYHRKSGNLISFLIPFIGMILDLSLIIQYRKRISHQIICIIDLVYYFAYGSIDRADILLWYFSDQHIHQYFHDPDVRSGNGGAEPEPCI